MPTALASTDNELTPVVRELLMERYQQLLQLRQQINTLTRRIAIQASADPAFDRLQAMPGMGRICASALLAAIGHGQQFSCGRQVSAWLGLVPRQHGSGGKSCYRHSHHASICHRHKDSDWIRVILKPRFNHINSGESPSNPYFGTMVKNRVGV